MNRIAHTPVRQGSNVITNLVQYFKKCINHKKYNLPIHTGFFTHGNEAEMHEKYIRRYFTTAKETHIK